MPLPIAFIATKLTARARAYIGCFPTFAYRLRVDLGPQPRQPLRDLARTQPENVRDLNLRETGRDPKRDFPSRPAMSVDRGFANNRIFRWTLRNRVELVAPFRPAWLERKEGP